MTNLLSNLNPREIDTLTVFFDSINVCGIKGTEKFYIPDMKIDWCDMDTINGGAEELCLDLSETLPHRSAETPLSQIPIDNLMLLIDYIEGIYVEQPDYDADDDEPCFIEGHIVDPLKAGKLAASLFSLKDYLHGINAARGYLTMPEAAA